jgi:hypothetical protein
MRRCICGIRRISLGRRWRRNRVCGPAFAGGRFPWEAGLSWGAGQLVGGRPVGGGIWSVRDPDFYAGGDDCWLVWRPAIGDSSVVGGGVLDHAGHLGLRQFRVKNERQVYCAGLRPGPREVFSANSAPRPAIFVLKAGRATAPDGGWGRPWRLSAAGQGRETGSVWRIGSGLGFSTQSAQRGTQSPQRSAWMPEAICPGGAVGVS